MLAQHLDARREAASGGGSGDYRFLCCRWRVSAVAGLRETVTLSLRDGPMPSYFDSAWSISPRAKRSRRISNAVAPLRSRRSVRVVPQQRRQHRPFHREILHAVFARYRGGRTALPFANFTRRPVVDSSRATRSQTPSSSFVTQQRSSRALPQQHAAGLHPGATRRSGAGSMPPRVRTSI